LHSGNFENTIAAVLEHYPAGMYLAAVSGGADSTAMLAALAAVRNRKSFDLRCIHIEHGIRPAAESRGDAAFVRSLCEKLHVPCRIISIAPGKIAAAAQKRGIGIEAAARLYRRRAWFREAVRLEAQQIEAESCAMPVRVLTAHTADDMLETVLMRFLRGSGPSGLATMPVSRGRILRPLIALNRRDVLDYLNEKSISWREDSTNTDRQFLRNRIRHCLIPLLEESFPQWRVGVAALAETQSFAADFIQSEAASRIQWGVGSGVDREQQSSSPQSLYADVKIFFAQSPIIREEALFQGIDKLLPSARISRTIKRKNIRRFCEGNITAMDLGPLRLTKDSRQIIISTPTAHCSLLTAHSHESGFSLLIKAPGSYNLKGIALEVRECPSGGNGEDVFYAGVFYAQLPLVLRPCFNDDYIEWRGKKLTPAELKSTGVIAAVDSRGVAAFIGSAGGDAVGLLQRRENDSAVQVAITVNNGGIDV